MKCEIHLHASANVSILVEVEPGKDITPKQVKLLYPESKAGEFAKWLRDLAKAVEESATS